MAFYIEYRCHGQTFKNAQWYLGQEKPSINGLLQYLKLQADGDELRELQRLFTGIPMITWDGVCKWLDPWSTFIFFNM